MPRELKFEPTASNAVLIKTTTVEPVITVFDVARVVYQRHTKPDKPDSLRVSYYTKGGMRRFDEWILLEHSGGAQHRARLWWLRRSPVIPQTVTEALAMAEELPVPIQIRVRTDTKFPEITDHNLAGVENDIRSQRPTIAVKTDEGPGDAQKDGKQWITA
jgi:hypothetical protein